ncbi:MAG TPA: RNA polymerase factor sigma-54 [Tissierellaceae bacterium]|nr:RNA polymerase factor sigma-54 [Tissierellaceae bacterium]
MKLGYNLELKQTQKLVMTQELRQAIELLQFNTIELNDYIKEEMKENPLLERENSEETIEKEDTQEDEIDWEAYVENYDNTSYRPQIDKNEDEYSFESFVSHSPSLREHLLRQLYIIELSIEEYEIGEYLVQSIDENGYLNTTIEEVIDLFKVSEEKVKRILKDIQSLDPLGVGAKDLKECLLIQIKDKNIDPVVKKIIEKHLDDIANNRIKKISQSLNIDIKKVQKACDFIKRLEPKPGRKFTENSNDVEYIMPDATIRWIDGEFEIIVNESTGPRLNINNFYKELLTNQSDKDTIDFLSERLNSAMWIIKSIEQRRQTIYKVIQSILKFQYEFFKVGDEGLVPLTLKDVAEDIGMHQSTVSRAAKGKYVQTPKGLYELSYFFTTGLSGKTTDVSSTSVKTMIKDLIDNEDSRKPYSDQKIADILKDKGTKISRRTVAKYRAELEIPSSNLRRRYA